MIAYFTCCACQDTWHRDLIDLEVQAYIKAHPELKERILAGEITDVDLDEMLCDTCGDPAYDCGCDDDQILDLEDEIDRKVNLMEYGRL